MIKEKYINFVLLSAVISSSVIIPEQLLGRNIFYIYSSVVIIGSFFYFKKLRIARQDLILGAAIFLIGASQLLWSWRFPAHLTEIYRADTNYPKTGTYLIIGSVVISLFPAIMRLSGTGQQRNTTHYLLFGFITLTLYAVYCKIIAPGERLRINTSSTLSAALYTMYSLLTLYSLLRTSMHYRKVLASLVIFSSLYILILTETRSALIVYPVILLYILFKKYAVAKWKALSICALSFILFSLMIGVFSPNVYKRANEVITDITLYQQNNNTSIGARLTMWYSGINEIITHPGGVSAKERYQILADFINKNENGNPEALRNIAYHLHNDLIETMSLQGAASGLFLFFFYITLIYYMTRKKPSYAALFLCLPVLFFGTVDSLFIHVRFVIMLIGWLIIYTGLTGALLVEDTPSPPLKKSNEAD